MLWNNDNGNILATLVTGHLAGNRIVISSVIFLSVFWGSIEVAFI